MNLAKNRGKKPLPQVGWRACLKLGFAANDGRTVLADRSHSGPLRVQRPFYPEGVAGPCHVYLLHPPGGVVGGDELNININVQPGANALITTPAANKFYRSAGATAVVAQTLSVADGGSLEWLPQDNIVFSGAMARQRTRVDLAGTASFIGWEITSLGRPAAGELFARGDFDTKLELWRDGRPLLIERTNLAAPGAMFAAPWGLNGATVFGTLVCVGKFVDAVGVLRRQWENRNIDCMTVTQLDQVLVCRYLGDRADHARDLLNEAWTVLRPLALGREAHAPRIWAT